MTLLVVIAPSMAAAADHGAGHAPAFMDLKWFWVNFLIYVFALFFILRNPVKRGWLARREAIASAVAAAQKDAEAARQELLEAQRKLSSLESDSSKMSADIERETQREAAEILTQAKVRAERITRQSKELAEAERKATESLIRRELVAIAVERARERLQREVNAQADKELRDMALGAVRQLVQ